MYLIVVGLNHKTAPVEIRERLSIPEDGFADALSALKSDTVSETLILSTCNRIEVYAYCLKRSTDILVDRLGRFCHAPTEDFAPYLYSFAGHKAVEHLFRVASGIDSMVLGEAQVLGQVKEAYAAAGICGACGPVLNTLFRQAITAGKRARTETEIGRGACSVGSAAVRLAKSIFDDLQGKTVLVVGAGKMSKLAITHLVSAGVNSLLVANRSRARAEALSSEVNGQAVEFGDLPSVLGTADIVITSTGSPKPIITREMVSISMRSRRGRPSFFIDMAVPRDVDPLAGDLNNVFLYNIDDLQSVVEDDAAARRCEISQVEAIVAEEVEKFLDWFRALDAAPVITALRDKFESIRLGEFERLKARLSTASPEDLDAINAAMRSVVNRICHQPMLTIKEYAAEEDSADKLETVREIFGVAPEEDKPKEGT